MFKFYIKKFCWIQGIVIAIVAFYWLCVLIDTYQAIFAVSVLGIMAITFVSAVLYVINKAINWAIIPCKDCRYKNKCGSTPFCTYYNDSAPTNKEKMNCNNYEEERSK